MPDLFRTVLLNLYALDVKKVAGAKVLVNSVDAEDANGRTPTTFSRSYTMNENGEALDTDGNPLIVLPVDANKAIHYLFRFKTNLGQFSSYDVFLVPGDPIDFQTLRNLGKIDFSPDFYAQIDAHIDERVDSELGDVTTNLSLIYGIAKL